MMVRTNKRTIITKIANQKYKTRTTYKIRCVCCYRF